MWRLPLIFAFIGMVSLCLNFQSSEAIAQTTEPTATPLLDLTLPPNGKRFPQSRTSTLARPSSMM